MSSDQTNVSADTARLLPPEGAEPGSVWELRCPEGNAPELFDRVFARWDGQLWEVERTKWFFSTAMMAERGYTLADPIGMNAAVRLLQEAGVKLFEFAFYPSHIRCGIYDNDSWGCEGHHSASALVAAQAALAEWREATAR